LAARQYASIRASSCASTVASATGAMLVTAIDQTFLGRERERRCRLRQRGAKLGESGADYKHLRHSVTTFGGVR
jgi:hypothetical protein